MQKQGAGADSCQNRWNEPAQHAEVGVAAVAPHGKQVASHEHEQDGSSGLLGRQYCGGQGHGDRGRSGQRGLGDTAQGRHDHEQDPGGRGQSGEHRGLSTVRRVGA